MTPFLVGKRADDHPSAAQRHEGGGEADPAGARLVGDPGEQRRLAARGDLHDRGAGACTLALLLTLLTSTSPRYKSPVLRGTTATP